MVMSHVWTESGDVPMDALVKSFLFTSSSVGRIKKPNELASKSTLKLTLHFNGSNLSLHLM